MGSPDLAATAARVNIMFTLHEVQNNSTLKLARLLISNVRGVETANSVCKKLVEGEAPASEAAG